MLVLEPTAVPFQYRVEPMAYNAWVVVAGVLEASTMPLVVTVMPEKVLVPAINNPNVEVPETVSVLEIFTGPFIVVVANVEVAVTVRHAKARHAAAVA